MSTPPILDYIIVGQGLAGSCLSIQLIERGKRFLMIDQIQENSATRIAAGLFNPIAGKMFSKAWKVDECFPYLHTFYAAAEKRTGTNFFRPMPLYRPFISVEEQNEWMGKSAESQYSNYIDVIHTSPFQATQVKNNFGGLLLKQCGYLNTILFCTALREYIQQNEILLSEPFNEAQLLVHDDFVEYKGYKAQKIIFCQGESSKNNSFFSWLPIRGLKGETITLITDENINMIYNRGVYLVPGLWKVGATYDPKDTSRVITDAGLEELKQKLDELICFPYKISQQLWGMRPVTLDRRPILGPHPEHKSVVIFNGLGTKGVSLAPHFSKVLIEWLENGVPVDKEVDIHRYKHYYYAGNQMR